MALNVLIVDDSAIMRQMILKTLRMCGLPIGEVHQAGNGREGLEVIARQWIDLLLVDINMPVMNGQEMIERLRERPEGRDMAIIVVSTDGSEARIEMMQRQGASFVQKPFSPETLRDRIVEKTGISEVNDARPTADGTLPSDGPDF
ncbi:MAG: response regulator [Candidatus Eisenbacteria bacterium]|nr:response regulator [Candidatus Eisenbacteria bacterium]